MDARPTLDVTQLDSSHALRRRRRRMLSQRLLMHIGPKSSKLYYVMRKYRNTQRDLLGHDSIEDPDPFAPTYVFYCFTGNPPSEE